MAKCERNGSEYQATRAKLKLSESVAGQCKLRKRHSGSGSPGSVRSGFG